MLSSYRLYYVEFIEVKISWGFCEGDQFLFIDNDNIDESCLNNSKLHQRYYIGHFILHRYYIHISLVTLNSERDKYFKSKYKKFTL